MLIMRPSRRRCGLVVAFVSAALIPFAAELRAHGETLKTGSGGGGPVHLTKAQQGAIGLKTVSADLRDLSYVLLVKGSVMSDPARQAFVTTRIEGRVQKLHVRLGDPVRAGQAVLDVQSRQFGDPPPIVSVTAPISGVIDERNVVLGEAVNPEKNLLHIVDLSTVIVQAQVYEEDIGKIALNQIARVHLLAYPESTFPGKITYLGQRLDPEKRTLPVWITVKNSGNRMKPEMFATAAVILSTSKDSLTVPKAAVLEEGGEKFVFLQNGEKFDRVDIATGLEDDLFVEVKDGLVPGDLVVTDGKRELYTSWLTGGPETKDDADDAGKH
jgi:multidrug efflux pump subunit AcrA (membrane-fusion protein)